jgi:hypothetical protein
MGAYEFHRLLLPPADEFVRKIARFPGKIHWKDGVYAKISLHKIHDSLYNDRVAVVAFGALLKKGGIGAVLFGRRKTKI